LPCIGKRVLFVFSFWVMGANVVFRHDDEPRFLNVREELLATAQVQVLGQV
jgi:hypothetical protein